MEIREILVVDDEKSISSYLQKKLAKLGYAVRVAADGEEALREAFLKSPDLVLLDVKLPKLSGLEVCRNLKADHRTKNVPVVMLSAKAQSAEIQRGLEAGADKYLCKPLSFPDIVREIQALDRT